MSIAYGDYKMTLLVEFLALFLSICLAAATLTLSRIFSGSVFAAIPKYMLVLAGSLVLHSSADLFLTGPIQSFVYGLTALIESLGYLLLVYGTYAVLTKISNRGGDR